MLQEKKIHICYFHFKFITTNYNRAQSHYASIVIYSSTFLDVYFISFLSNLWHLPHLCPVMASILCQGDNWVHQWGSPTLSNPAPPSLGSWTWAWGGSASNCAPGVSNQSKVVAVCTQGRQCHSVLGWQLRVERQPTPYLGMQGI